MDKFKFEYEMKRKGFKYHTLSEAVGMSRTALYRKVNGKSEFTLSEIQQIVTVLGLDTPVGIFFNEKVS